MKIYFIYNKLLFLVLTFFTGKPKVKSLRI